jgi:hypothetical protein
MRKHLSVLGASTAKGRVGILISALACSFLIVELHATVTMDIDAGEARSRNRFGATYVIESNPTRRCRPATIHVWRARVPDLHGRTSPRIAEMARDLGECVYDAS